MNPGQSFFQNGQFVDIYAWPDPEPPEQPVPIYFGMNPRNDEFQDRASSSGHMIFTGAKVVFDVGGITGNTLQYGPGEHPPRAENLPFAAFPDTPPPIPCFVAGTMIATPSGPRAVEDLRPGDLVETLDHGPRPLRWVGDRVVAGLGPLAPVRIAAQALGNDADLYVSQQHRMLIANGKAELYFGADSVLVAAAHLVNGDDITLRPMERVRYLHLAFDRHEVIFAAGIPTESLHLGPVGWAALDPAQRGELLTIFPELAGKAGAATARPCLRRWEAALIA